MNDTTPDRVRLYRFYTWLYRPTGIYSLSAVLQQLRDIELLHLMKGLTNRNAVVIAWAEYGRRHHLADISFSMTLRDVLEVSAKDLVLAAGVGAA